MPGTGTPVQIGDKASLIPSYDLANRSFTVQLVVEGQGTITLGDKPWWLSHTDDVLDHIDEFLSEAGHEGLTANQAAQLAQELIIAKAAAWQDDLRHP